jgi:predicted secreted protein
MEMELDVSSASHGGHTERLPIVTNMMDKQVCGPFTSETHAQGLQLSDIVGYVSSCS